MIVEVKQGQDILKSGANFSEIRRGMEASSKLFADNPTAPVSLRNWGFSWYNLITGFVKPAPT